MSTANDDIILIDSDDGTPLVVVDSEFSFNPRGVEGLLDACIEAADRGCQYGDGAGCFQLPQGVRRSVCTACRTRKALELLDAR